MLYSLENQAEFAVQRDGNIKCKRLLTIFLLASNA